MKYLIFAVILAGGAYIFPQLYEEVDSPCQALERKALRVNTDAQSASSGLANLLLSATAGSLGREMAADEYPDLPARLGCLATYYNFPEDWRP